MVTTMAASCFVVMEDVPDTPHQPNAEFQFPKRSFGKKSIVHAVFSTPGLPSGLSCITKRPLM